MKDKQSTGMTAGVLARDETPRSLPPSENRPTNLPRLLTGLLALIGMLVPVCSWSAPRVGTHGIRHVFVIVLENKSYADTFKADTPAPFLAKTLTGQGALLADYYAIGHNSLGNYIAMISGQPPNEDTQEDCPVFNEFVSIEEGLDSLGRAVGRGCVYPAYVKTLGDQLQRVHLTWRGYMEDMGDDPARERAACAHSAIGSPETLLEATVRDQYAVKHNPFVYFHSIIDDQASCDGHVVALRKLPDDLKSTTTTPNFAFITPNLCNDGHDSPCVDGQRGGFSSADSFLQTWVPLILKSPAFREDGLLVVTFDEAEGDSAEDSLACCGEVGMPGAKLPPGMNGPGGGRVGAVLLSPFIKPGTVSSRPYNHYSLLRTVEDVFHLPHLALATGMEVRSFGKDVFIAAAKCCERP